MAAVRDSRGRFVSTGGGGGGGASGVLGAMGGGRFKIWAEIKGDIELHRKLNRFAPKLRKSFVQRALRRAARPMLVAARAEAPKETGAMAKAFYLRKLRVRDRNMQIMTVRSAKSQHERRGLRWYGSYQELGTKNNPAAKSLRRGFNREKGNAIRRYQESLRADIEAEARRR